MNASVFTIIGAAHDDQTIQLSGATHLHRTNPAIQHVTAGGVAANIARHLAAGMAGHGHRPHFIGVAGQRQRDMLLGEFAAQGIKAVFIAKDGPTPSYTAVLDSDGELVVGAACMALYDDVRPVDINAHLPQTGTVIIDANFPADVIAAIADNLALPISLFAAGTSVEKIDRLTPIIQRLDGLVLNRAEAAVLCAEADAPLDISVKDMALNLVAKVRRGGFVLVSDGGDAAALAIGNDVVSIIPPVINPLNVNGAGDVMAAALFGYAGRNKAIAKADMQQALEQAVQAGADYAAGANLRDRELERADEIH